MALWLCRGGKHGEYEQKFLNEKRIYLTWEGLNHDLNKFITTKDLYNFLGQVYPNASVGKRKQHTGQIWSFSHRMNSGDWIALPSKRKTIHIGEIKGKYVFAPEGTDPYYHYHNVAWLETDIPRTNFDQDILYSLGAISTICQIKRNDAENRVRSMQKNNWKSVGVRSFPEDNSEVIDEVAETEIDLEQTARDQVARLIYSKFSGHGLEDLVVAILNAKGFTTYHSDKGADGGVDILAAPSVLGFGQPRICVQVKSQDSPLERPILDQLVGTMQHVQADQGLLVCWGGFKPTIKREISRLFFKVRLWDQNDLIDHLLDNYDKLDEDIRAELPLKRIWTVASKELEA